MLVILFCIYVYYSQTTFFFCVVCFDCDSCSADDETERKRKKKSRVMMGEEAGLGPGSRTPFGFENADRVKQIISSVQTDGSYITKENAIGDLKVV